jgi:ABC-type sugar transport system substrate-binding protein
MPDARLALCLVDAHNDFQELLQADALAAARRAGLELDIHFTGHDLSAQLNLLRACIDKQPKAILVLAVRDHGLARIARDAARVGVGFVFLNRTEDDLEEVRRDHPAVPVFTDCADEIETGRIHGRQFRALLPKGGSVLYVQGSTRSLAAADRTSGMQEVVAGSGVEVVLVQAGWSADESRDAVGRWLRIAARGQKRIDLVGCHNDQIAQGALDAFRAAAGELARPELARVPVIGCDGTPGLGQRLVREGQLLATVVLPRSSGPAVERVARFLASGEMPPPSVLLAASSHPELASLRPLRG